MSTEIMRRLKHLEPIAELRTQSIYNNHMYTALGEVVTRVSGQPWEQFAAERILRPLDMKSTTADVAGIPRDRLALRHWRSDAGIAARAGGSMDTAGSRRWRPVFDRDRHGPMAQTATE